MRAFSCATCGQLLFFENTVCLGCGAKLGFVPATRQLGPVPPGQRACANARIAACNWLVPEDDWNPYCLSCRLTRTRPNDADREAMDAFRLAEIAKRRLLFQVLSLDLPIRGRGELPETGLAFDLLWSRNQQVMTGHEDGIITLDLSESDAVHREFVRLQLGEPYRTVLGHLRHEIAHYFWPILVETDQATIDAFRQLFGDERLGYDAALARHYASGPPADWKKHYVSAYATMHPWEDWAETFAHFLHIVAGVQTALAFGVRVGEPSARAARRAMGVLDDPAQPLERDGDTGSLIEHWLTLTFALNAMAQSLGQEPLYPFVLAPTVMSKLDFVRERIAAVGGAVTDTGARSGVGVSGASGSGGQ